MALVMNEDGTTVNHRSLSILERFFLWKGCMKMEVKRTLTMPKTPFEMRGNLSSKEPAFQKRWLNYDLYHKRLQRNQYGRSFLLHDGPPYANGDIHVGHALNKILKDFVVRYHNMLGDYSPYIPGWDTHGLPIESVLQKKGIDRKTMALDQYRSLCAEYAQSQVERQKVQFQRLGRMGDYDQSYVTLTKDYEAMQIHVFATMALKGLIYKGAKPVYWSPSSESALAEAEIEYHDVTSPSIYVKFDVSKPQQGLKGNEAFVIWTTTPWTLPANLAISVHPDYDYGIYDSDEGSFIFLANRSEMLIETLQLHHVVLRKVVKGKDLEGIQAKHPFYQRDSLVLVGEHVTADTGTGCVHTAPGHGEDDFLVGTRYGLEPFCPVDHRGCMTEEAGSDLAGLFYEKANQVILSKLETTGHLLSSSTITHAYPHDWRTKKPVIYRATAQWFASIDGIREQLLQAIHEVKWYPEWGELRLHNMIAERGDWCISRQRAWGVPIPILYAEDDTPIMDSEVSEHIETLFRTHGSNIWFTSREKDLLPPNYANSHSPNGIFRKETDIMDVWFDSGSSHTAVLIQRGLPYPADLYLEGSDQYRGWFNSSLIIGQAVNNQSPYRAVVSHGFVLDGNGNKMSKSLGNTVDPNKVMDTSGADILRLWVASVDYQSDVRISDAILKQMADVYRKIRNTFRFLLGNLSDGDFGKFDPSKNYPMESSPLETMILNRLAQVYEQAIQGYERYDFSSVLQSITSFLTIDMSSFYLDITKDILYCEHKDSPRRRAVQKVLWECLNVLVRLLAPILPHTCEELYDYFPTRLEESVHLLNLQAPSTMFQASLNREYELLLEVRNDVLKALEAKRGVGLLGSSQEARIQFWPNKKETQELFHQLSPLEMNRFFIVSEAIMADNEGDSFDSSKVSVHLHDGYRCERCWNRYDVSLNEEHLCPRCSKAVNQYRVEEKLNEIS
jgi:isoleucyl-tRNA synthetase